MNHPYKYIIVAGLLLGGLLNPAWGIHPGKWTHGSQADFTPGKNKDTVVTSLGEVRLAAGATLLDRLAEEAGVVTALQPLRDGSLILAVGPETSLLRRQAGKTETLLTLEDEQVFALALLSDGRLLVGVSGTDAARLAVLDGKQLKTLATLPGVRYIWDMLVEKNHVILATGTDGALIDVDLDLASQTPAPGTATAPKPAPSGPDSSPATQPAQASAPAHDADDEGDGDDDDDDAEDQLDLPAYAHVLMQCKQANLLCLGRDAVGRLYVGTDTDGLVYRVTRTAKGDPEIYVLFDAPEPEIGAILVKPDGTVFLGTADADQAHAGAGRDIDSNAPPHMNEPMSPTPAPVAGDAANHADADAPGGAKETVHPAPETAVKTITEKSGADAAEPSPRTFAGRPSTLPGNMPMPPGMMSPGNSDGSSKPGNAVYRIDPQGYVRELFREPVMILRLCDDPTQPGRLLVATGNEGLLYRIDPQTEETTVLLDLEAQAIAAMTVTDTGDVLLGTCAPALLVKLEKGTAGKGTYTSTVLDASQISRWGVLHLTTKLPGQTTVAVQTRSGNVQDPDKAAWSKWSEAVTLQADPNLAPLAPVEIRIDSPPARFVQYRLTLAGNGQASPMVNRVELSYVTPNAKPIITAIHAEHPNQPQPQPGNQPGGPNPAAMMMNRPMPNPGNPRGPMMPGGNPGGGDTDVPEPAASLNLAWEASDPNNDRMKFKLEYQVAGNDQWILLADDLTDPTFDWPIRRMPDGRYLVRVTASDSPDNTPETALSASRTSSTITIDNTPPRFKDVKTDVQGTTATLKLKVVDDLTTLREVKYAVDATKDWHATLPEDMIFDSTSEALTIKIPDLKPGPHLVTLRALDDQGNSRYEAVRIEVK